MPKTIYLSPENRPRPHGSYTGQAGCYEHDICCAIAGLLAVELARNGFDYCIAPPYTSMAKRIAQANSIPADLYLTIHTNAGGGTGAEVLYYNHPASIKACQCCYDELTKLYPSKRGLKDGSKNYYEIANSNMVSVYPELAFHDNAKDAAFLVSHKNELAAALAKGICNYFGTTYKPAQKPAEPCKACIQKDAVIQQIKETIGAYPNEN